jgi:hypothetical protein
LTLSLIAVIGGEVVDRSSSDHCHMRPSALGCNATLNVSPFSRTLKRTEMIAFLAFSRQIL